MHQVFQSRDGYLWVATEGGAARFDGFSFKTLNHTTEPVFASDDISAIAQDAAGALWFGTADGLIERNGESFRRFDERDGLPSATVLGLSAGSDGLLVLTSRGLVRLQGGRFVSASSRDLNVISLETTGKGDTWLITSAGVLEYSRGAVKPNPFPTGDSAPEQNILEVQAGRDAAVWRRYAGAVTVSMKGMKRTMEARRDLPGTRTTALFIDRKGVAWIGTNRGLASFDPASHAAEEHQSLHGESVLSLMEDREGNLWIGTEASGLHVLRPRQFRSEAAAAGEAVTAGVTASDGTIWYGTRKEGLHAIVHGSASQPVADSQLTSPVILSLASGKQGDIWAGTPDGLNRVKGREVQQYNSSNGLPDDFVRSVLVDSQGETWAGTRQGLVRIGNDSGRSRITTYTEADGLGSDSIGPILEATPALNNSGEARSAPTSVDLWIGTSAGLSHFSRNKLESFSTHASGAASVVTALARDSSGSLWVALHGGGLSRFAGGRFHAVSAPALPAEIVSLSIDREGYLWLRGLEGVFRTALAEVNECVDDSRRCQFSVASYGLAEGLPSDAVAAEGTPAMWQGPKGELWIATRKGIAVAETENTPVNLVPPPVVLQRFLVDDADVPLDTGDVRVDPGHKRYTFNYAALSYTLPSRVRYHYMLEGFDRDWIDAGSQRAASYTSLPPRKYRFRVRAENEDGIWNLSGAELQFRILPSFYRRWWFYGLLLLAASGIAWLFFRLRLRVLQRRFALVLNERSRVAREIHDTLAQDLVSVSLQLDLAAHMLKTREHEHAATQLLATRKLVKEGLESARQSIWNLRADAAEDSLPSRLTALVKRYGDKQHSPRLKIGGAFRKLPVDVEDDVFRIAQESLANSYRHSAATEVSLQLQYEPETLRLNVGDNGQGFSVNEGKNKQGHYGLRGMQERATLLGATLTIESSPAGGTEVTLLLPLAPKKEGPR